MSEVAEEPMDSCSAASEDDVEERTPLEAQSSPKKSRTYVPAASEIMEGKRAKKTVERLDIQAPKPKEKLKFGDGRGEKLGDIPRTGYQIGKMKPADLKPLHAILFDRPGKISTMKKNMRLFNGFPFDVDSEQYAKKREKLLKNSNFTCAKLRFICKVLDLERKGNHADLVDKILSFLASPKSSGKRLISKKKKKSKKKLSGDDSDIKAKKKSKPKPRSLSASPKKSKTGSKSKAIVMDSSSDEDEDEEDDKVEASAEAEGSDNEEKRSEKEEEEEEEQSDKSEESEGEDDEEEEGPDDDDDDEDEEGSSKSKSGRGKSASKKAAPAKRQRAPTKKTGPPKKRAKKDDSDRSESDGDSEADEKPKKKKRKKAAAAKPAAKTKKADSSSNSKKNTNTEGSSDDDAPLIKMIKKAPSDEQLRETVQKLLEEADLEEMTMKQICQRVYDTYPDHDLTSRKDYIKQTVKSLIT